MANKVVTSTLGFMKSSFRCHTSTVARSRRSHGVPPMCSQVACQTEILKSRGFKGLIGKGLWLTEKERSACHGFLMSASGRILPQMLYFLLCRRSIWLSEACFC